jgi:hypothetical protein
MPYSSLSGPVGHQQFALFGLPDTTQRVQYGLVGDFVDPYWGGAQAIYAKAGGSIRQGGLCVITPAISGGQVQYVATEVPNTANLGRSLYVAMTPMTSGQFGWLASSGVVPVNCQAAVAADTTFGIAAAGQGGANTAGKQVLGARVVLASSTTVAKQGVAANNSTRLQVAGDAGWFIGAYLSGTGIAAGTTITDIDPSGTQVTLSAVTTAAVNGTVTATYNNGTIFYNVAHINNPIAQGAIT